MTDVLTQFDMLSPDAFRDYVNGLYGREVIDRFGVLDPALMEAQVNAARGSAVFLPNGPLSRGVNDPWNLGTLDEELTPGGPYVAKAVHFDGSSWLSRGQGIFGSDGNAVLLSLWVANGDPDFFQYCFSSPNGYLEFYPDSDDSPLLLLDEGETDQLYGSGPVTTGSVWHHVLLKIKPGALTLDTAGQLVVDGVYQTQVGELPFTMVSGSLPFSPQLSTETDFIVGGDGGEGAKCDLAQFYLAYGAGADVDLSDSAVVAKFIVDGRPVDVLTSGAPSPLVLFDGNETGFSVNKGTAGAFSLTGALTNASTSPSD